MPATNALRTNNQLAEAHLALAVTKCSDCKWGEAEREHLEALQLKPQLARRRTIGTRGAWSCKEAATWRTKRWKKAQGPAPSDPIIVCNVGKIHYYAGDFRTAVTTYQQALNLAPDFRKAHWDLGRAYAELGQLGKAIDELRQAKGLAEDGARPDRGGGLRLCEKRGRRGSPIAPEEA